MLKDATPSGRLCKMRLEWLSKGSVCTEVMNNNLNLELDVMRAKAKEQFNNWFFNKGGNQATEQEKLSKMQELLKIHEGRIGCNGPSLAKKKDRL